MLAAAGCSNAEQPATLAFEVSGRLEDKTIREASGLARSQRQPDLLWVINDNGAKEIIHAIDTSGNRLGEVDLKNSKNRDWEDLASFRLDDTPLLMVADIGDNEAKRAQRTLYFVAEPQPAKKAATKLSWKTDYTYPDGPRDAESAAVDIENRQALIISKRDLPPRLYAVPLQPDSDETVAAIKLGEITSLRAPSRQEVEFAPKYKSWHWQPVGMDISDDSLAAVILTYRTLYYYERSPDQSWLQALNSAPLRVGLGNFKNAEAVAFGDAARTVFVTGENKNSRILRIDLSGVTTSNENAD